MPREPQDLDPYAPPPRYKEKSGGIVRVALIAAMLGLGVWGYTQFSDSNAPPLVAEEQTQQVADNGMPDNGYAVTPTPDAPAAPADTAAPAPATPQRSAPSAAPAEPVPAPSTTIGAPPAG